MQYERVWSGELCLVGAPNERPALPATVRLADLARYPLIMPSRPHAVRSRVEAECSRHGVTLDVTYHFGVGKRLGPGWRLFFLLDGPAGYRNLDHVPVEGLMPLERWRPGQELRDRQIIPIPPGTPAGTYTLYLGAYRGAERLPDKLTHRFDQTVPGWRRHSHAGSCG